MEEKLPWIYANVNVGVDCDERVLPSITTEVVKAVVAIVCVHVHACVCVCTCMYMHTCSASVLLHVG